MANVKSVRGKLTFPPSLKPCGFIHSGRMIICCLQIMTSSLAGERPPVRPAYFKPSAQPHCPGAFLTAESTCEVRFYFFFQSRWKRPVLIETYLTCGISLLCVNEGEGQGPPTPVSPCSLGECGWDTKGLIRCLGVGGLFQVLFLVSHTMVSGLSLQALNRKRVSSCPLVRRIFPHVGPGSHGWS